MAPKRDWSAANDKIEVKGRCRVCGRNGPLERAHISGRKFDQPKTPGSKTLYVHPDDIVPLCGTRIDRDRDIDKTREGCHHLYDSHRLDLLGFFSPAEQIRCVSNFQSIEGARRRLCPTEFQGA